MSNKLVLTQTALTATKNLQEMFELEAVRYNAIQNLIKTTGKTEEQAAMHYEREKILFFKISKKLESCDKFSIYSAWVELMASGSTLNEGNAFIIAYGKQAQFQMGWRGRLEQLIQIPVIENVPPPIVVYENDEFDYELGEKPRIIKHKPAKENRGERIAVYCVIQKTTGLETHLMLKEEVLKIRDVYSKPYIQYIKDCASLGKEVGSSFTKTITPRGQNSFDVTVEPPMWITSPDEAWKKTLVNRIYKWQPKTARMKALDECIKNNMDPENGEHIEETQDIDYGLAEDAKQLPESKSQESKPKKTRSIEPEPPTKKAPDESLGEPMDDNPVNDLPDLGNLSESF